MEVKEETYSEKKRKKECERKRRRNKKGISDNSFVSEPPVSTQRVTSHPKRLNQRDGQKIGLKYFSTVRG